MRLLQMAWRNLWRNWRRTIVTVAAMTLALFVMVLYSALIEGYLQNMEETILDIEMGDVQVFASDYRDKPSIYSRLEEPEELVAALEAQGFRASARLLGGGLVAAGESSAGAQLRGVEIEQDARVSEIYDHLRIGEWLDPADPEGVVLGAKLARTLGVDLGDELVVLSQATDGSIANDLYRVRGVLQAISDATDRGGIFLTDEAFRELFVLPDGAHQLIVRSPAEEELAVAVARIRELMPTLDVKSWRDLLPTLASLLDSTRGLIQIVFFVVYIVVAILIVNATLMAVFERIRELGVLKAIGVGPGRLLALILVEGALQTLLALTLGLALAVPGLIYLTRVGIDIGGLAGMSVMGIAMDPAWRGIVTPLTVIGPVFALLFIVFLSLLYPALKAARISPVEAMRHH